MTEAPKQVKICLDSRELKSHVPAELERLGATLPCDSCHKVRKLYFFKNVVDSGYLAYCKQCAFDLGYFNVDCMIEHKKGDSGFRRREYNEHID